MDDNFGQNEFNELLEKYNLQTEEEIFRKSIEEDITKVLTEKQTVEQAKENVNLKTERLSKTVLTMVFSLPASLLTLGKINAFETKIGSDGRAIKERHHTDHGHPKHHTNPHDHDIRWTPDGNPDFSGQHNYPKELYPDGAPPFN